MKETCLFHFHWSVIFLPNFTIFYTNKIVTGLCMFYRECRAIRLSKIILACPDLSVYDPVQGKEVQNAIYICTLPDGTGSCGKASGTDQKNCKSEQAAI